MSDNRKHEQQSETVRPTAQEVREYLPKLLGRSEFNVSERNRRFLSYVVEETLAGRRERIKAYSIALAAFDRGEDFDPLADPIVRIEAGRLRQGLKHYYLTAGKADPIRIDIPKGAYVATFAVADNAPLEPVADTGRSESTCIPSASKLQELRAATSRNWARILLLCALTLVGGFAAFGPWPYESQKVASGDSAGTPSIVVLPFANASADPRAAFVARGLTYELVAALTESGDLSVFGAAAYANNGEKAAAPADRDYSYALSGSTQVQGATVRIIAILADHPSGRVLESWSFESDTSARHYLDSQLGIVTQISTAVTRLAGEGAEAGGVQRTATMAINVQPSVLDRPGW